MGNRTFNTGSRRDSSEGKPPFSKLMWRALREVALVHEYGDLRYGQGNWRKGQPFSEVSNSMFRHWNSFFNHCEDYDTDQQAVEGDLRKGSGLLHTAHMAWNALFLLYMQCYPNNYADCDDRMTAFGDWFSKEFARTARAKQLEVGEQERDVS